MMAMTVGELNVLLGVDQSPFDRGLRQSEGRFSGFGSKLAGLAKKAAIGTSLALAGGAVAGVKSFADLESGMNEVFTLMPGISDKAMGKMTGQVKDFSTEFGTLPNEAVPALYQSLSAGVPPGNVFDFMETAQKAATGGVTDLSTAVDGITSVVNNYGEDVIDAARASDLMFTTVRLGKTDFGQLSASIGNVLPYAAAAGVGFEDISAAMSVMAAKTGQTAESSTKLRQMMIELSDDTKGVGADFEEVAGKSFKDFIAGGGNVQGALKLLEQHAEDSGLGIEQLFSSTEAGAASLLLSGENAADFTAAMDEMAGSAGATEAAYNRMDQGIGRSFDKIKAAGAVALANVGESLAPLVASMAGWAEDTLPKVAQAVGPAITTAITTANTVISTAVDLWGRFKVPILAVAGVITASYIPRLVAATVATVVNLAKQGVAWVVARGKALGSIAMQTAGMVKMVAKYAWMGAQSLIHAGKVAASWVIAMGPVGWVIAAVVGLVALIIANWSKVKKWTAKIWSWISEKVASAWQWIKDTTSKAVDAVKKAVSTGFEVVKKVVKVAMRVVLATMTGGLSEVVIAVVKNWDKVKATFSAGRDAVIRFVGNLRDRVVGFFGALRDRVIASASTLKDRVVGFFGNIKDRVVAAASRLASEAVAKFGELKDGALEKARQLLDYVTGLPGELVSAIGNVGSLLFDKGSDVVRGLWDGIKSMGSWIKGKVTGFVKNAVPGPIASALGISSPSTVAADLAREVPRGMMVGMDAESSKLVAASERMAERALPSLPGVRPGSIGGDGASIGMGSSDRDVLERIARAVERGDTDWDQVAKTIGRETAREQQLRQRTR